MNLKPLVYLAVLGKLASPAYAAEASNVAVMQAPNAGLEHAIERFESDTGVNLKTWDFRSVLWTGTVKYDPQTVDSLRDIVLSLPPKVQKSIHGIIVFPDGKGENQWQKAMQANIGTSCGGFSDRDQVIRIPRSNLNRSTIYHEAAHARTYDAGNGFPIVMHAWFRAAGDLYRKDLETGSSTTDRVRWKDGSDGPRHGFVCAYGANNYMEDIATFAESIDNPELFKPLVDPKNPDSGLYVKKLQVLLEYGFITQEQFDRIFK